MSAVIQDRAGSITRTNAGEVDFKLFMYKDRKKKTRRRCRFIFICKRI